MNEFIKIAHEIQKTILIVFNKVVSIDWILKRFKIIGEDKILNSLPIDNITELVMENEK